MRKIQIGSAAEKKARPVQVKTLSPSPWSKESYVAGTVGSWKTEQIGMEVSGRIEWVVEPNTYIEGRVRTDEDELLVEGTPIARINKERYEIQVKSQKAQVLRAQQAIAAAVVQRDFTLPAQLSAAEAEKKRAQTQYERSKRLLGQRAGSQSEVDRDEATRQAAISQIEQIKASMKAQEAEVQSLQAQLLQARTPCETRSEILKTALCTHRFEVRFRTWMLCRAASSLPASLLPPFE